MTHKAMRLTIMTFLAAVSTVSGAMGAENFQRLKGAQIHARIAGMEMTDGTHWADVFGPRGVLTTFSMGRKIVGKWWVKGDELCVDRGKDSEGCYEVQISGQNVELRRHGSNLPREAILQRPAKRN